MKRIIILIGLASVIMLRCSSVGSIGDLSGGGVIGNPLTPEAGFTDTLHQKTETVNNCQIGPNGQVIPLVKPSGSNESQVNKEQQYSCTGYTGTKRFKYSTPLGQQFSSWMSDSEMVWTWTTAGLCSVQVQLIVRTDTSTLSKPLIVQIIK
jgi:hypothetical protein